MNATQTLYHYQYLFALIFSLLVFFTVLIFRKKVATKISATFVKFVNIGYGLFLLAIHIPWFIFFINKGWWWHFTFGDLCTFLGLAFPVATLSNNKLLLRVLTPWLLLGGLLTLASQFPVIGKGETLFEQEWSFLKHLSFVIYGLFGLLVLGQYRKKDYIAMYVFIAIFILWIILIAGIPYWVTGDVKWAVFSTGLLRPTYYDIPIYFHGKLIETTGAYAFFNDIGMPFPLPTILFYALSCSIVGLCAFLCQYINSFFNGKPLKKKKKNNKNNIKKYFQKLWKNKFLKRKSK